MKKVLAIILAMMMLLGCVACVKETATVAETKPQETTEAAPKAEAAEPAAQPAEQQGTKPGEEVEGREAGDLYSWILDDDTSKSGTVRYWTPYGAKTTEPMIAAFNEVYPNITIEYSTYSNNSDGNLQVDTAIMAEEIDVLLANNLNYASRRWDNNLYMDITDLIEKDGIDLVSNFGTDYYNVDGRFYTLPAQGRAYFTIINKNAWEKAGLGEIPQEWTWDEYLAASAAMTEYDANGEVLVYGGSDINSIETFLYPIRQMTGHAPNYDAETGLTSYGSEIALKSLKRELKAELEDKIWYSLATYRAEDLQCPVAFATNKINSTTTFNALSTICNVEKYPRDFITAFAPYPVEEKGQDNYATSIGISGYFGMAYNCQDVEASWTFLKWLSTYGTMYYLPNGYFPTWKGSDLSLIVPTLFGSEEAAKDIIDLDSFNFVFNGAVQNPHCWFDQIWTKQDDICTVMNKYVLSAARGEISAEEALQKSQEECDAILKDAQ